MNNLLMYKGLELEAYCRQNNLTYKSIYYTFKRRKLNAKSSSLTNEELLDTIIKEYKKKKGIFYNGILLKDYCIENDINYTNLMNRINHNHDKYPNKEDDEIISLSIDEYKRSRASYSYKGMPLEEFCKKNPKYSLNGLKAFIVKALTNDPNSNIDDIVDDYIKMKKTSNSKYFFEGVTLKEYCLKNNISYSSVIAQIGIRRNNPNYKGMSDEELIKLAISSIVKVRNSYTYKGMPLVTYCRSNGYNYAQIYQYVKRHLGEGTSIDDLIDEAIAGKQNYRCKYYYNGMSLSKCCKKYSMNLLSLRNAITKMVRENPDRDVDDIVKECVEKYQKFKVKYTYKGMTLADYCAINNLNYNLIMCRFKKEYLTRDDISMDEAFDEIIESLKKCPARYDHYTVDGLPLSAYCDNNNISYHSITDRIKSYEKKYGVQVDESNIKEVIDEYKKSTKKYRYSDIFNGLKNNENINVAFDACRKLRIDFDKVVENHRFGLSFYQSIAIIWFASDDKNDLNDLTISERKAGLICKLADYMKNGVAYKDLEKIGLYNLYTVYKSNLFDSRKYILQFYEKDLNKLVKDLFIKYYITYNVSLYYSFRMELEKILLDGIEKCYLNDNEKVIESLDKYMTSMFEKLLKEYKKGNVIVSEEKHPNGAKKLIYKPNEQK